MFILPEASKAGTGFTLTSVQLQGHRCLVKEPPGLPPDAPVVFVLHGLGANANDLAGLCEELRLPPCLFVMPDAPLHLPGYPPDGLAWYDLESPRLEDFVNSQDYLFKLLDYFSKYPASFSGANRKSRPIILVGFSQGGLMALMGGLNYKGRIKAVVSMSGYIWEPSKTIPHPFLSKKTPILMVHGSADTLINDDVTQSTGVALGRAGYHPVLKVFAMGHQITAESLGAVADFLNSVLRNNPNGGKKN